MLLVGNVSCYAAKQLQANSLIFGRVIKIVYKLKLDILGQSVSAENARVGHCWCCCCIDWHSTFAASFVIQSIYSRPIVCLCVLRSMSYKSIPRHVLIVTRSMQRSDCSLARAALCSPPVSDESTLVRPSAIVPTWTRIELPLSANRGNINIKSAEAYKPFIGFWQPRMLSDVYTCCRVGQESEATNSWSYM